MIGFPSGDLVAWAVVLALGFPLAVIALGLLRNVLRRRGSPLAGVVRHVQNLLVPTAVLFLFVVHVVGDEADGTTARTLLTVALLSGLYVLLAFVSEVVFGAAREGTWQANTPKLLRDIVIILMIAAGGAVVAASVWDQDVAGLVTALGVGSIVIGLALQQTLGNVMSGIALLMEKPFTEGDFVEIDGTEGTVEQINWRATRIKNRLGDLVILPHSITSGAKILNNTSTDATDAVLIDLGFGYEHPPGEVKRMLMGVLDGMEGVVADPPPSVSTVDYGDSAVIYRAVFRVDHPLNKFPVRDRFMTRVWYAAQRAGITIPFPIRTVHHFDGDKLSPDRTPEAVREVADGLFASGGLSDEQLDEWARGATLKHFGDGEVAIRQGGTGSSLYVILAGTAVVTHAPAAAGGEAGGEARTEPVELYELGRGDFFGEVTLFSGARSPYAVTARGDLETLSLSADTVNRIIENRPSLAVQIGRMIDTRRREITQLAA